MKKILFSTLFFVCSASFAQNSYDGIFQERNQSGSWLSIHVSGGSLIGTIYNVDSLENNPISLFNGIKPKQLNTWNLLQGSLYGNFANVSGEVKFGACKIDAEIFFAKNTASFAVKSAIATTVGQENKIDCAKIFPAGQKIFFDKIFNNEIDATKYSGGVVVDDPILSCSTQYSLQKVATSFNIENKLDIPISRLGYKMQYFFPFAAIPLIAEGEFYFDFVGGLAAGTRKHFSLEPNMYHDFSVKAKEYCNYPGGRLTVQPIYFLDKDGKRYDLN